MSSTRKLFENVAGVYESVQRGDIEFGILENETDGIRIIIQKTEENEQ